MNITSNNCNSNRLLKKSSASPVQEMTSEPMCRTNNLLHDINKAVPIKLASPTSVVPVEATSTIQDHADLGVASPSARKQLSFNESESSGATPGININTPAQSPDFLFGEGEDRVEPLLKTGGPFKDRFNRLHSSPHYSEMDYYDYGDDDYPGTTEAEDGISKLIAKYIFSV